MDNNTAMEAAAEGAKALTKLLEIIQKIFNPHWTRKQDKADAKSDERRIKMIRDNPDMDISFVNGQMSARQKTDQELAQRAEQRLLAESIRQENNIENVIEVAEADLTLENITVDETVDEDWVARFFNIVKDIGNEEMQYVWGKILAGEIKKPGSFSLRTLQVISNISKIEAEKFRKIMPYIVNTGNTLCIAAYDDLLNAINVSYKDILVLSECGLLLSSIKLETNKYITENDRLYMFNDQNVAIIKGEISNKKVSMQVYSLSTAGSELYNALAHSPDANYFIELAKTIKKKNNINVDVYKIVKINGSMITYDDSDIVASL